MFCFFFPFCFSNLADVYSAANDASIELVNDFEVTNALLSSRIIYIKTGSVRSVRSECSEELNAVGLCLYLSPIING